MDCNAPVRKKDCHSNLEHYAVMSNSCMAIQETKVLVSEQKVSYIQLCHFTTFESLTRYASFAIVSNKICSSEVTGLGSLQGKNST